MYLTCRASREKISFNLIFFYIQTNRPYLFVHLYKFDHINIINKNCLISDILSCLHMPLRFCYAGVTLEHTPFSTENHGKIYTPIGYLLYILFSYYLNYYIYYLHKYMYY